MAPELGHTSHDVVRVLIAQAINRKGTKELEIRSKREETMRNLRWASELAIKDDDRMAGLGVSQLAALLNSDLLDEAKRVCVEAALDAVYPGRSELDQLGDDVSMWSSTS